MKKQSRFQLRNRLSSSGRPTSRLMLSAKALATAVAGLSSFGIIALMVAPSTNKSTLLNVGEESTIKDSQASTASALRENMSFNMQTEKSAIKKSDDEKNLLKTNIKSHGFGVDLNKVLNFFVRARKQGKFGIKVTWEPEGWIYSDKEICPEADMSCYFKPLNFSALPDKPTPRQFYKQLLIPNGKTKQELEERLQNQNDLPSPTPCGVIHVRHADVLLNHGWGNKSETPLFKYLELEDYVKAFKKATPTIQHVVLLTDDQAVIDDVPKYNDTKTGLHIHYIQRKRFRGAEGGWENHFPSGSRKEELVTLLLLAEVVSKCSLWVGTGSSFARVLQDLMEVPPKVVMLDNKRPLKLKEPKKRR